MAWGASGGAIDEQTLIMRELISLMQNNVSYMNPVDVTSMRRILEITASTGVATSIVALQAFATDL